MIDEMMKSRAIPLLIISRLSDMPYPSFQLRNPPRPTIQQQLFQISIDILHPHVFKQHEIRHAEHSRPKRSKRMPTPIAHAT